MYRITGGFPVVGNTTEKSPSLEDECMRLGSGAETNVPRDRDPTERDLHARESARAGDDAVAVSAPTIGVLVPGDPSTRQHTAPTGG